MTDLDMGLAAGVSDKTVRRWRQRNNVPNFRGERPSPGDR